MRENISAVELACSYENTPFGKCNALLGYAIFAAMLIWNYLGFDSVLYYSVYKLQKRNTEIYS